MSDVFISCSRIDACCNDPTSGRGDQDNVLDDTFARGFKVKPNKDSSGLPGVNATLYACSVGERAYEWADKEHGVFSYYLLQGLRGQSVNNKGQVMITDLANYIQHGSCGTYGTMACKGENSKPPG